MEGRKGGRRGEKTGNEKMAESMKSREETEEARSMVRKGGKEDRVALHCLYNTYRLWKRTHGLLYSVL